MKLSDARKESGVLARELSPERAGSEGESIPGLSVMQTDVFSCLYVTIWAGPLVSCKQKSKIRLGIFGYSRGIFLAFFNFYYYYLINLFLGRLRVASLNRALKMRT